jgi:competence protein ComFA
VLEIAERMQAAFPMLKVVAVCEGHTHVSDGDLIVCTMHQLYRYHGWFDLLIMDEVDAFPYRGNPLLARIAAYACAGEKMMLTATPDEEMKQLALHGKLMMVELFSRPHGYPLIVPTIRQLPKAVQYLYLFQYLLRQRKRDIQTLVFVPTIALAKSLYQIYRWMFKCQVFTSLTTNKEQIIDEFHQKKYECLFSTTVLERGITIRGIYILIIQADHPVFNEASLIQMIGRVGRKKENPTGEGVFLCQRKTKDIIACVNAIQKMNESI